MEYQNDAIRRLCSLQVSRLRPAQIGGSAMKHSVYFDGKVQSLGVNTDEGYATVGGMEPGKYTFSTSQEEHMNVIVGSMKVKLPGSDTWQVFSAGQKFVVAPGKSFDLELEKDAVYVCYYK